MAGLMPSPGFPVIRLPNGADVSFWFERDSESLWFIWKKGSDVDYTGSLNFQLGDIYINSRGGVENYAVECLFKIRAKMKALFPDLFGASPAPVEGFGPDLLALGQQSVDFAAFMAKLDAKALIS
jgi:hypothetical protein